MPNTADDVVERAEFEIIQDDMVVATTSGPRERALAEAKHYASVYLMDGPVEVFEVVRRRLSTVSETKDEGLKLSDATRRMEKIVGAPFVFNEFASSPQSAPQVGDENPLIPRMMGRAKFKRDSGQHKDAALYEEAIAALTNTAQLVEALEGNSGPLADAARLIAIRHSSTAHGQAREYVSAKENIIQALSQYNGKGDRI